MIHVLKQIDISRSFGSKITTFILRYYQFITCYVVIPLTPRHQSSFKKFQAMECQSEAHLIFENKIWKQH